MGCGVQCPSCKSGSTIQRGSAYGCTDCGTIWIREGVMLSAPLLDPRTITKEDRIITRAEYGRLRGCTKFDLGCVVCALLRR